MKTKFANRNQFQNGHEAFPAPPPRDVDGDEVEYPLRPVSSNQNITTSRRHPSINSNNGIPGDKVRNEHYPLFEKQVFMDNESYKM